METVFRFLKHEFSPEQGKAVFFYQLQTPEKTYDFTETLTFPAQNLPTTNSQLLTTILDSLLLVLGISYWKTTCAKKIELPKTITLHKAQAAFWNTLYTKGMGEFYYKNQLDFRGLVSFPYDTVILEGGRLGDRPIESHENKVQESQTRDPIASLRSFQDDNETMQQSNTRSLLFFGGGKDSIVSAELLKKHHKPFTLFMVNTSTIQEQTAALVGAEKLVVTRTIDPQLLELNKQQGVYNGHVPVLAMWSFISLLMAELFDFNYIITSNEQSANYGNVDYLGIEVNHQWDKSEEFEYMFGTYVKENITDHVSYFSLLRPFHEIKIAQIFSTYEQYFPYFSSCNRNFKLPTTNYQLPTTKPWCGECPKCLFVFIILSAFIPKEKLLTIFGKNLYADERLLPLFKQLIGKENVKPFECVGTPEETLLGLKLATQKGAYENDVLMTYAQKEVLPIIKNSSTLEEPLLAALSTGTLPAAFADVL